MTSGQMLLAGFNGLFTKVASELTDMFAAFEQVHFDKHGLQFDIVKDAQDLQVEFIFAFYNLHIISLLEIKIIFPS